MTSLEEFQAAKRSGRYRIGIDKPIEFDKDNPSPQPTPRIEYVKVPKENNHWHAINFIMMLMISILLGLAVYRLYFTTPAQAEVVEKPIPVEKIIEKKVYVEDKASKKKS